MLVVARIAGDETTFLLGSREVAGDTELDVFSEKSPLGAAIHGHKAGDELSYTAPNGKEIKVEVISAKPYVG
jgi:transcription elongation factor GreA